MESEILSHHPSRSQKADATEQSVKRRAACDECRTSNLLKCSGEQPACARCRKENITCVYSPQKQMGRPKKRQRTDDENMTERLVGSATASSQQQQQQYSMDNNPWLQSADWTIPSEHSMPGLTPDSASNSPPTINLPPESQTQNYIHRYNHLPSQPQENSAQLLLNPSLAAAGMNLGAAQSGLPSCACLSSMYLTLNTLQQLDQFAFPFALHPLREAMQTSSEVLRCEQCPRRFITAIQNTQLIGTLLMSIAERFGRVIESINNESIRANLANETKKFRLADLNTSTSHLHTGGIGCAAAFSIDLSPAEWRAMAKKVVRAEVHGPSDGNTCCTYLMGLTKQMEDRQEKWMGAPIPHDFPLDSSGVPIGGKHIPREDHLCLKLVAYCRKIIDAYDWS
ncbi:hypothetical protein M433DRAFT_63440 [Acidomyces richmondensis BFW]|nr:MAG: hypothetical protein FE78DRAFT_536153 [Acidomyces sp. 'richmondensis']KYG47261.1 hypothetical protein M433DRAFT_63440 [Acidomyces richmondensis BFW]